MPFANTPTALIIPELAAYLATRAAELPYPGENISWLEFSDTHAVGDAPAGAVEVAAIAHNDNEQVPRVAYTLNVRLLISNAAQGDLLAELADAHEWLVGILKQLGRTGLQPGATFNGQSVTLFSGLRVIESRWTPRWNLDRSGTGAVLVTCSLSDPAFTTSGGTRNALMGWGFGTLS